MKNEIFHHFRIRIIEKIKPWKNTDPSFPEVEDAKERLAGLKSH